MDAQRAAAADEMMYAARRISGVPQSGSCIDVYLCLLAWLASSWRYDRGVFACNVWKDRSYSETHNPSDMILNEGLGGPRADGLEREQTQVILRQ